MLTSQNQRQKNNNQMLQDRTLLRESRNLVLETNSDEEIRKNKAIEKIAREIPEFKAMKTNMEHSNRIINNFSWQTIESLALYVEYSIPLQYFPNKTLELFYKMAQLCKIPQFSNHEVITIKEIHQKYSMKSEIPQKISCSEQAKIISDCELQINKNLTRKNQDESFIALEDLNDTANEKISQDNDDKTSVGFSVQNQSDEKQNTKNNNRYNFLSVNQFIQSFKKLPLRQQKSNVSNAVIKSVENMNSWIKVQQNVQISEQKSNRNQKNKRKNQSSSQMVIQLSERPSLRNIDDKNTNTRGSGVKIVIGLNQRAQTKQARDLIKTRAMDNFISKKQRQELSFSDIQKAVQEIHFQLNKVSPGNIQHIFEVLRPYIIGQKQSVKKMTIPICLGLIKMIIEKCETEHNRYIGTYAQLLSMFSKIPKDKFLMQNTQLQQVLCNLSKGNKFKSMLVDAVQQQFHQKLQSRKLIEVSQIRGVLRHSLLGLLRLIADLLKQKVLSKRIANICLSSMTLNLLKIVKQQKNCTTKIYKGILQHYVEIYIHGFLQFLTDMSEHLEYRIKSEDKNNQTSSSILTKVRLILNLSFSKQKDPELFQMFCLLKVQDFVKLVEVFNQSSYRQVRSTLQTDILLQNYKDNILSEHQEIESSVFLQKMQRTGEQSNDRDHNAIAKAAPRIREIFQQGHKSNKQNKQTCEKQLKLLLKQSKHQSLINLRCLLRLIADGRKQNVLKNLENLKRSIYQLEDPEVWNTLFSISWKKQFQYLSTQFSDMKQLTDIVAELIHVSMKLSNGDIKQYVIISNDQDEIDFMDQILEKYYVIANFISDV